MTAILRELHRRGPLRLDRFAEPYRHCLAALEQLHLVQPHGAYYRLAADVEQTFTGLQAPLGETTSLR